MDSPRRWRSLGATAALSLLAVACATPEADRFIEEGKTSLQAYAENANTETVKLKKMWRDRAHEANGLAALLALEQETDTIEIPAAEWGDPPAVRRVVDPVVVEGILDEYRAKLAEIDAADERIDAGWAAAQGDLEDSILLSDRARALLEMSGASSENIDTATEALVRYLRENR